MPKVVVAEVNDKTATVARVVAYGTEMNAALHALTIGKMKMIILQKILAQIPICNSEVCVCRNIRENFQSTSKEY